MHGIGLSKICKMASFLRNDTKSGSMRLNKATKISKHAHFLEVKITLFLKLLIIKKIEIP